MRAWLIAAAAVAAALIIAEIATQPTASDRITLAVVLAGGAIAAGIIAVLAPRVARRLPSVQATVLGVAFAALILAGGVVGASAGTMFLSGHDLRVVLVALGLGMVLGGVLAYSLTKPLAQDLRRMRQAARRSGVGDFAARTGVERADEVGDVARALDEMITRLQAVDSARRDLLAAIGHDLRTPLTALRAALEALRDGVAPDPDRYLTAMEHELRYVSSLVDDLLTLARIEAGALGGERVRFGLAELADEAIEALSPIANRKGVELSFEWEPIEVEGEPQQLGRVIRNLLDNAIRFAPQGSTVTVELANGAATARLVVTDEGPGFGGDDDVLQPFTRPDQSRARAGGGAGLGLAIADGIVKAHGGRLRILPGPGGHVVVELPAASTGGRSIQAVGS